MELNKYIDIVLYGNGKRNISNEIPEISMLEVENLICKNRATVLIDVRSPQEFEEGHLPGAILIPSYEMKGKAEKVLINKDCSIILYCSTGIRSKKSAMVLKELGYKKVYILEQR